MVKGKCEALTNTLCIIRAIVPHTHTHTQKKKKKKKKTSNCYTVMWTGFITTYISRIDACGLFQ